MFFSTPVSLSCLPVLCPSLTSQSSSRHLPAQDKCTANHDWIGNSKATNPRGSSWRKNGRCKLSLPPSITLPTIQPLHVSLHWGPYYVPSMTSLLTPYFSFRSINCLIAWREGWDMTLQTENNIDQAAPSPCTLGIMNITGAWDGHWAQMMRQGAKSTRDQHVQPLSLWAGCCSCPT